MQTPAAGIQGLGNAISFLERAEAGTDTTESIQ